jgi:hypothetical protein
VAQAESSGGEPKQVAKQPQRMREQGDPVYGQYPGFIAQYKARGAQGVDNFASDVLRYHPDATLGQFYSTYVLGTGHPSWPLYTPDNLKGSNRQYYNNLMNTAKRLNYDPDRTLLSDLVRQD